MNTTTETKFTIWDQCTRCGGTGSIKNGIEEIEIIVDDDGNRHEITNACFKCRGNGGKYISQEMLDRRERDRARRAERKEREAEAKKIQARERLTAFVTEHPAEVKALNTMGAFGIQLKEALRAQGYLTEGQLDIIRQRLNNQGATVIEGRGPITGVIKSIKESIYPDPYTHKKVRKVRMTVADQRGFTVNGSLPKTLDTAAEAANIGDTVEFTATIKGSDDDEHFGFFTRPARAQIIERNEDEG